MRAGLGLVKSPACILVVDDEPRNRQLLEVMLAAEGHRVTVACGGQEAMQIVELHPPDLILLDVMMAGMDGYQVASALKADARTARIPIIMLTALSDRQSRVLGLSAGAEDFLTKPVDRTELSLRVKSLLRLKAYADDYEDYSQALESEVASRTRELVERTEKLEQQAQLLTDQAALLDLAHDAIMVQDMERRVRYWNPGAVAMYGWSRDEALGKISSELLQEESTASIEEREAELLMHAHWEGEVVRRHRDGRRIDVINRLTLQRDAHGVPVQVLSLDTDITDRKHAAAEQQALTERLSLATAVARVGVWEWDRVDNTLTWDETMFSLYGLSPLRPLPYQAWAAAIFPEDLTAVEAMRHKVIDEKGSGSVEFRITRPDGLRRDISAIEKAVLDDGGNVVRVVGVNLDVTDQRAAEKALARLREEELRFKDDFLSHVSHELRSPLTAIKQFTSILRSGVAGDLNAEQHQYQAIVIKNVHQLQLMIDDLLEVTRLETGKLVLEFGSVSISTVVADAVDTLQVTARSKGVAVSCGELQALPPVNADETRLLQILIILLDNAVKFTPAGGAVVVRAQRLPADPSFLLVEVSDTGCGIESGMSGKLFDRLYQVPDEGKSSRKGLGLGLYICKELVLRHGGDIWVRSEPGIGSTFSFSLPLYAMDRLIAPLIRNGRWPADRCALLTVRLGQLESRSHSSGNWAQETQSLVQRCLLPNLHLLLPVRRSVPGEYLFFVAVFADDYDTAVLESMILERFKSSLSLNQAGRSLSVSHVLLPRFERDVKSPDLAAAGMVADLEAAIAAQVSNGPVRKARRKETAGGASSQDAMITADQVQVTTSRRDGHPGTFRS